MELWLYSGIGDKANYYMQSISKYGQVLKDTFKDYSIKSGMNYSSSIAFYIIFSLPAILVITLTIAGTFYSDEMVRESIMTQFERIFGGESMALIERLLTNAAENTDENGIRWISIITLLISATTVFAALQDGINEFWNVQPKSDKNLYNFIKNRLISLVIAASIGILLLSSLLYETTASLLSNSEWVEQSFINGEWFSLLNPVIILLFTMLVFAGLFKAIPDAKVQWRNVWFGAFITTVLFALGKEGMALYIGNSSFESIYGASGSLVIFLIWIYFSSMIVLFGAQLTAKYSEIMEGGVEPLDYAVVVEETEKEKG